MDKRTVDLHIAHPHLQYEAEALQELFHFLDTLELYSIPDGDLSIALLDDASICQLHADFLDDPSPTDVITFPGDPEDDFAGEICVSVDYAHSQHTDFNTEFAEELTLYLVHGWLHLAGLDDTNEAARKAMRAGEAVVMEALKTSEKLPYFKWMA